MTLKMLYLGQKTSDVKPFLYHWWYILASEKYPAITNDGTPLAWDPDRSCTYKKVHPYNCRPGAVFTFDGEEDGAMVIPTSARDFERWACQEDVAAWEIKAREARLRSQERSLVAKMAKEPDFDVLVEPLRRIYQRLSFSQKDVFILHLLKRVRGRG